MVVTVVQIAALLDTKSPPESSGRTISRVSAIGTATPDAIVFAADEKALMEALASSAGLILASTHSPDLRVLTVKDPRTAFARVYRQWFDTRGRQGIDPRAIIEPSAQIGPDCEIGAGTYIAGGVVIGANCVLSPRVVIHAGTTLGDRVRVQAGAVLGSDGFGYVREPAGYFGFPQIGTLWIGDDVEIGANTAIDRGALGETRIGRGTKIDNLVHIAHNCILGEDVIIAAQVGMAGSTIIEDGVMLGGQAGLGERVTIGKGVILGGQGGVLPGKRLDGPGRGLLGTPALPVREYLRNLVRSRRS